MRSVGVPLHPSPSAKEQYNGNNTWLSEVIEETLVTNKEQSLHEKENNREKQLQQRLN